MKMFAQNLIDALKNASFSVLFLIFFIISTSANAAVPTVINTVPNAGAHHLKLFEMPLKTYEIFDDADGDVLTLTFKQADNSDLPTWMKVKNKLPVPPSLKGTFATSGYAMGVASVGNYAYITDDVDGLTIVNISDQENPTFVGRWNATEIAQGVAVKGNYAYIANDIVGLKVIDISNPETPSLAGTCPTGGVAHDVVIDGNYAYLVNGNLQVIDISSPSNPNLVGTYTTPGYAQVVKVSGNYAYIADGNAGLTIANISIPSSPSFEGNLDTTGYSYDVSVSDNYAYIADDTEGLRIIDVSTPSAPNLDGTFDTAGAAKSVKVVGNYAYVADWDEGLKVIDISTPATPTLFESLDTTGFARKIAVFGNYIYIADWNEGLKIIEGIGDGVVLCGIPDIIENLNLNLKVTASDGSNEVSTTFDIYNENSVPIVKNLIPHQMTNNGQPFDLSIATYEIFKDLDSDALRLTVKQADGSDLPSWLTVDKKDIACNLINTLPSYGSGIDISDNYIYVGGGGDFHVLDISIPTTPNEVGTLPGVSPTGIKVAGNYAYVTDGSSLKIVDISVPSNPVLAGTVSTSDLAYGIDLDGIYAYVITVNITTATLRIFDVSDPENPSFVELFDLQSAPGNRLGAAAIYNNYAYVPDYNYRLKIVDVSTPSSPSLAGTFATTGYATEAAFYNNYTYVVGWNDGLDIIDVSTPSSPNLMGNVDTTNVETRIRVVGDYVYVVSDSSSNAVTIIDVSDPSNPIIAKSWNGFETRSVAVSGDYAYVTDSNGLRILEIGEGIRLTGTPSIDDVGTLNLKVTASDGVDEVSTTFSVNVQNTVPTVSDVPKSGPEDTIMPFTSLDFTNQFSDPDGNSLTKIQVLSLPTNGTLKLSSTPVAIDQEIDIGDLNNLTFDPETHWNGLTSFSWNGFDGYSYTTTSANVNITITTSQDAPTVSDFYKSGPENTSLPFAALDFTDHFEDLDGDGLTKIQVKGLALNGALELSSVPVALDQEVLLGDLSNLAFEPNTDWSGNTNFTWQGHDGTEYSSNIAAVYLSINNAPSITDIPKSGPEDTTLTFTLTDFTDHFTDANDNDLNKIQVLSLPDNGELKLLSAAVTTDQEIDAADLNDLTFDPDFNWNGATSLTWQANDGFTYSNVANVNITINPGQDTPSSSDFSKQGPANTSLSFAAIDFTNNFDDVDGEGLTKIQVKDLPLNGTLELSSSPVAQDQEILLGDLNNLTFEPLTDWSGNTSFTWQGNDGIEYSTTATVYILINDSPVITDVPKSGTEDTTLTFTAGDFTSRFSDSTGDSLVQIQVLDLPDNGSLKLSSTPVLLNQEILAGDLDSLTFEPDEGWNGDTSFSWQAFDGFVYSNTANVNINIAAVNDSPTVSDISKAGFEDTTLLFTATDFTDHFSDFEGDGLAKIQVTSLPSNGTLKLLSASVTQNQEIDAGDLGNLKFVPEEHWHGETSFTWKGHDGTEYSALDANVNITINAAQDAPTITDIDKMGLSNIVLPFSKTDFTDNFQDKDSDLLTKIQTMSLPLNGQLKLAAGSVSLSQEIIAEELSNLNFVPNTDWHGLTTFSWRANDGTDYSDTANVNILINDPPTITDLPKSGTEDITMTFSSTDFIDHFSDTNGNGLTKIQILSLPVNGTLKLLAADVTQNQEVLAGDLNNLSFEPNLNWHGDDFFAWKAYDGFAYSNIANVNITISPAQDLPTVSNFTKFGMEETLMVFSSEDFSAHFQDIDGTGLAKVQITSLPLNGALKLLDTPVALDQESVEDDLDTLTFNPDLNWNGLTSFTWKGSDGTNYSLADATVNINIAAVRDAPIVSSILKYGSEDTVLPFLAADFTNHFTDVDGNVLTKIQVTSLPLHGTLKLSSVVVTVDQEIDIADLDNLTFEPDTHWNGDTVFNWKGHNGVEYSLITAGVYMTIDPANDIPTVTVADTALDFNECDASVFVDDFLTVTDVDNVPLMSASAALVGGFNSAVDSLQFTNRFGIIGSYANGELTLSGSATAEEYQQALRSVKFQHLGSSIPTSPLSVAFSVNDGSVDSLLDYRDITINPDIADCGFEPPLADDPRGGSNVGGILGSIFGTTMGVCAGIATTAAITTGIIFVMKNKRLGCFKGDAGNAEPIEIEMEGSDKV